MPLHRGDLNDAQWQKLYPLLPKKARTGRPAADHPCDYQWHFMDSPHGCAVERFARMLWVTWYGIESL